MSHETGETTGGLSPEHLEALSASAETLQTLEAITFARIPQEGKEANDYEVFLREVSMGTMARYVQKDGEDIWVSMSSGFGKHEGKDAPRPLGERSGNLPAIYNDMIVTYSSLVSITRIANRNEQLLYTFWNVLGPEPLAVITRETQDYYEDFHELNPELKSVSAERIEHHLQSAASDEERAELEGLLEMVQEQTVLWEQGREARGDKVVLSATEARELTALLIEAEQNGTEEAEVTKIKFV
jgi:hypothetical protein